MFKGESFPSLTAWDHHEFPWYPADRRIVRRDTWSSHTWPEKSHWRKSRQRLHLGSSNTLESRNHSQINTNDTKKLGASPTFQHHILPGPTSTSSNHATTWARFRLNFQVAVPRHWQGLAPNKVLTNSLGNLPWYGGRQATQRAKVETPSKRMEMSHWNWYVFSPGPLYLSGFWSFWFHLIRFGSILFEIPQRLWMDPNLSSRKCFQVSYVFDKNSSFKYTRYAPGQVWQVTLPLGNLF